MKKILLLMLSFVVLLPFSCSDIRSRQRKIDIHAFYKKEKFSAKEKAIYKALFDPIIERAALNGAVIISIDGYPIYQYIKGYSDIIQRKNLTENTIYHLASVSKMFTAMAIMQLHEKGLLEYSDSVQKHIPEFPYKGMTIEHLLQHTSGIPNYIYLMESAWPENKFMNNNDVLNFLVKKKPTVNNSAGGRWIYSNAGYAMLAIVIERISGISYGQYMKKNIFDPLGMVQTYTSDQLPRKEPTKDIAKGYYSPRLSAQVFNEDKFTRVMGDKGIYSTITDMLQWQRGLLHYAIIQESTFSQAFTPCKKINGDSIPYGYGWRLQSLAGKPFYYHNGNWNGFVSAFASRPDIGLNVTVLCNTRQKVGVLSRKLIAAYENYHGISSIDMDKVKFDD